VIKRLADFCTNLAVASFAIGLYKEGDAGALFGGVVALAGCFFLTYLEGKR
jgi:hypothetical protein